MRPGLPLKPSETTYISTYLGLAPAACHAPAFDLFDVDLDRGGCPFRL